MGAPELKPQNTMSESETPLYFYTFSPYCNEVLEKNIKNLGYNSFKKLYEFNELSEIYQSHLKTLCIIHIDGLESAKSFLESAQALSAHLKSGNHRLLISIENIEEKLKLKFSQINYLEVIPNNLNAQSIISKLERHLKLLNSSTHSNKTQKYNNGLVHIVKPLKDIYETWVLTQNHQIQKILTQWSLHLYGPHPEEGRWLVSGELLWKWVFKENSENKLEKGHWFYKGQRPEFNRGYWTFTGPSPKLYFSSNEKIFAIKLQCTPDNDSIEVAKNNRQTEKFWNKNKKFTSPLKLKNTKNIFSFVDEAKNINSYFTEAQSEKCEADVWLSGSTSPYKGAVVLFDKESNIFTVEMKSKSQTDRLFEQMDSLHETQVYLSLKYKRGRIFFKTGLIGRVNTKMTLETPKKIFEIQRRRNFRYELIQNEIIPTSFSYGQDNHKKAHGQIKNISSGGCAILVSKEKQLEFHSGLPIRNIEINIRDKKLNVSGTIKHSEFTDSNTDIEKVLLIGVQFNSLEPNDIQFLDFYVFEKCREYFLSWL